MGPLYLHRHRPRVIRHQQESPFVSGRGSYVARGGGPRTSSTPSTRSTTTSASASNRVNVAISRSQDGDAGLDRPRQTHLHCKHDVVRAGIGVDVMQKCLVRGHAGRVRIGPTVGGEIVNYSEALIGKRSRQPLDTSISVDPHGPACPTRRQPSGNPGILLMESEESKALAP